MKTNLILLGMVIAEKYRLKMEGIYPKVKIAISIQKTVFPMLIFIMSMTSVNSQPLGSNTGQVAEYIKENNLFIADINDSYVIDGFKMYDMIVATPTCSKRYYFIEHGNEDFVCYAIDVEPYSHLYDTFLKEIKRNKYVEPNIYYCIDSDFYFKINNSIQKITLCKNLSVLR